MTFAAPGAIAAPAIPSPSLFDGLDPKARATLQDKLNWFSLPGGRVLFEAGEPADGLYIVLSGALGVVSGRASDAGSLISVIEAGQIAGEMALLSHRPRSATVIALRDSTLLRVSQAAFTELIATNPSAMLQVTTVLASRLERMTHSPAWRFMPKTLAVLALDPNVSTETLCHSLAQTVQQTGKKVKVLTAEDAAQPSELYFHRVEMAHDLTIYDGHAFGSAWSHLCIRRGDRILFAASAGTDPELIPPAAGRIARLPWRSVEIVFIHRHGRRHAAAVGAWIKQLPVRQHYHIRGGDKADIARLARCLTGRAVGLVLSAGGARGYGHIGVVKALREAGVPIDMVGGCSFGAIVAGGVACEWDDAELYDRFQRAFVRSDPLRDYGLPFVSLIKGREVARRLQHHFGDVRIEDLWCPYFAVAANLTTGGASVLQAGKLWEAMQASIAIPGLLPPSIVDGEVLVDGGLVNSLPISIMKTMCQGTIIAVDVARYRTLRPSHEPRPPWWRRLFVSRELDGLSIFDLLSSGALASSDAHAKLSRQTADLLLELPLMDVGMLDWRAIDRAVEAGYRYTMARTEELERVRQRSEGLGDPNAAPIDGNQPQCC